VLTVRLNPPGCPKVPRGGEAPLKARRHLQALFGKNGDASLCEKPIRSFGIVNPIFFEEDFERVDGVSPPPSRRRMLAGKHVSELVGRIGNALEDVLRGVGREGCHLEREDGHGALIPQQGRCFLGRFRVFGFEECHEGRLMIIRYQIKPTMQRAS